MTRLILFFKNIHAQNIYKFSSVSIHLIFSSDIHDVETSFFTQKINTDIWPILVTLCFLGKQKIQSQVSIGFLGIYYTVFTVFKGFFEKGKKWYKLVHLFGLIKNPSNVLEELS